MKTIKNIGIASLGWLGFWILVVTILKIIE